MSINMKQERTELQQLWLLKYNLNTFVWLLSVANHFNE